MGNKPLIIRESQRNMICFNCGTQMKEVYGPDGEFWSYNCQRCYRIYNPKLGVIHKGKNVKNYS